MSFESWIADRTAGMDSSGIRKVFDLAAKLKDPVNLSIGQPDFDVPAPVRQAACDAINSGRNGYSQTQGITELREKLDARIKASLGHDDRQVFVASGTSGALVLALLATVNPGDEVIVFDPYFVQYPTIISLAGGTMVTVDTYPDYRIDLEKLEAAITSRTKVILFNSPANPTGAVAEQATVKGIAELAAQHNVMLISDEIYNLFTYDDTFVSPAVTNPNTLVVDGFSKSYGMTGWRVGFVHGPGGIIEELLKLQQFMFVCSPHPLQVAAAAAMEVDMSDYVNQYRGKRDRICQGLADKYEIVTPGGAFYVFVKAPRGILGSEFVLQAIERGLLMIPGNIFSQRDTHFRISYAASDDTIDRAIEILRDLA
ncbi:MAG: pyridoxal phosphate-dependent aminotransferase [Pirellulales bacterium]|nr:pyridoxal phosphate-dependent aminotransferase [Pirellulales bacterium]